MALLPFALVASAALAMPQVEVSTLTGKQHRGELVALDDSSLALKQADADVKVPLTDLLGVRFTGKAPGKPVERGLSHVIFRDGSSFHATTVTATSVKANFGSTRLGDFNVPRTAVLSMRFDSDRSVDDAWGKLLKRQRKRDFLVVKKKGNATKGNVPVLDFIEGIVLTVGEDEVRFLLAGDEIPIPRTRVFGVIYADNKTDTPKPLCEIILHHSGRLLATEFHWTGTEATATLAAGGKVKIEAAAIRELDFSLGKVKYLSQMEPREVKYTPFFDVEFKYRRDKNLDGDPLRLGTKTYARGLCIHSKTILVYRINTDYRRLQAVIGIDRAVAMKGLGDVHLVISNRDNKKVLFEADVRGTDKPRAIDIDVSQVRDLQILVDFGGDLDISDWLNLADARVTK